MKSIVFSFIFTFFSLSILAQVGIGTTTPAAALDITATDNGLLIPRVALTTTTSALPLTSPTVSELVYNNATVADVTPGYYYWDGTQWVRLAAGSSSTDWSIIGNAGLSSTTNFLGTTDNVDVVFRRNNLRAGFIGNSNTTSGNMNTSFGANSLVSSTGTRNVAIGTNVMPSNSTGTANVALGEQTMFSNTTGSENTVLGVGALFSNIAGNSNTALGRNALTANTASFNTAVGDRALNGNIGGSENTAVGNNALFLNTAGIRNTALGVQALRATTANNNTAIGYQAGNTITTGASNIMIGANTVAPVITGSNQLNIGNTLFGSMAGTLTSGVNTTRTIGVNVLSPQAALDIVSSNNGLLIPRLALTSTTAVLPVITGTTSELVYNTATAGDVTPGFYYLSAAAGPWLRLDGGPETDPQVSSSTPNRVPKWNGTTLVDGAITDTGATVGINSPTPAGALDINSTFDGFTFDGLVIPRVALNGLNIAAPLITPVTSELVYNTFDNIASAFLPILGRVTPGFYFWNGATWERFVTGVLPTSGWQTTGNTALATDFLGTINAIDLAFRRNNTNAGRITSTSTSFGANALTAGATTNATAFGVSALAANTGANNTAFGTGALSANTTSANNTAIGFNTLAINTPSSDTGAQNTAVGSGALASLNGGNNNTAVGFNALTSIGGLSLFNTAVGSNALRNISAQASQENVAVGYNAMGNTGGTITQTVAIGANALITANSNTTRNTAIGYSAGSNLTSGSDNIIIGDNAQVANAAGSNQIRLGDASILSASTQVAWTITSDKRWKNTIKDSELGLDFLQTLRPVSYIRNNDNANKTEYGFIAQELETAFINAGDANNAVISKDDAGMLGVRYNDFISISVKAIQEQQEQIEALKKANAELQKINELILKRLEALENK